MRKTFTKLLTVIALSLLTMGAMAQIFVDAGKTGGANNGTSWTNAYTNLQTAIDAANAGDQIWVAKGTYYPTKQLGTTTDRRDRTFILKEGVKVYGGFAGNELSDFGLDSRNFVANETILSGDFTGETGDEADEVTVVDGTVTAIAKNTTNAHHVVVSYNNTTVTVLDGFTISGGNADGTGTVTVDTYDFDRNRGAGVSSISSSPTFNNLIVKNNHAYAGNSTGAGIYLNGSKSGETLNITNSSILTNWASFIETDPPADPPTSTVNKGSGAGLYAVAPSGNTLPLNITHVTFTGNSAVGVGASIRVSTRANATLQDVWFTKNTAALGGAVYIGGGTLSITRGEFKENKANTQGGAIYTIAVKTILEDCHFEKNEGTAGGALHANTDGKYDIKNTTFKQNVGTTGGAIHGNLRSTFDIEGGVFEENIGTNGGAIHGISNASGAPAAFTIKGAKFIKNTTSGSNDGGGAIYGNTASNFTISESDFIENKTDGSGNRYGGAIHIISSASARLVVNNSKFIGNEANAAGGVYIAANNTTTPHAINNTIFFSNKTRSNGNGGALTFAGAPGTITNSTFYGNTTHGTGAGAGLRLTNSNNSNVNVYNSIILGNTSSTGADISVATGANTPTLTITHSLTQVATGPNVIAGANPVDIFVNPSITDIEHADFLRLKQEITNPAIDAGDNTKYDGATFGNLDPANFLRKYNFKALPEAIIDMGAYEAIPESVVLPVKISSALSAKVLSNVVQLSWATETETNNSHFILEKSTDGVNFVTIATPVSKGNGAKYSHTDFSPASGNNYYRLTQVDNDGTKVTYEPIVVNFSLKANEVSIYPNPTNGATVTVDFGSERYENLSVVNLSGQLLQSHNVAGASSAKIDVSALAKGVYLIKLSRPGVSTVQKLIKN